MAHPNGVHTYLPSGRFSVSRSYLAGIRFHCNSDNIPSLADGLFTVTSVSSPHIVQYVELAASFVDWTSNGWTLDHIIIADWYVILPSPTEYPNNGHSLEYRWDTTLRAMSLHLFFPVANTEYWFPLSSGGGGYWLNPVPG